MKIVFEGYKYSGEQICMFLVSAAEFNPWQEINGLTRSPNENCLCTQHNSCDLVMHMQQFIFTECYNGFYYLFLETNACGITSISFFLSEENKIQSG